MSLASESKTEEAIGNDWPEAMFVGLKETVMSLHVGWLLVIVTVAVFEPVVSKPSETEKEQVAEPTVLVGALTLTLATVSVLFSHEEPDKPVGQKVDVWAQDIKGIIYYIDKICNVYQVEDIVSNKINPKVIAKYIKNGENYSIPDFNL